MRSGLATFWLALALLIVVPAGSGSAVYGERSLDGAFGYSFGDVGEYEFSVALSPYAGGAVVGGFASTEPAIDAPYEGRIARFNGGGNQLWEDTFVAPGNILVEDVAASKLGAAVVGTTSGSLQDQAIAGEYDAFIRFYTVDGDLVWQSQFGTDAVDGNGGQDSIQSVAFADDHLYVSGYTHGALDGPRLGDAGDADAFVRMYDPDGTLIWGRQFGTTEVDTAQQLAVAGDRIYVGTFTHGSWPGVGNPPGEGDVVVQALEAATGEPLWTTRLGSSAYDSLEAMAVGDSQIYVGGATTGAFPGVTPSADRRDGWVAALDLDGTHAWVRQLDAQGEVRGLAAAEPGVVATGFVSGPLPDSDYEGPGEVFVRAYDTAGDAVWTRQFGSDRGDMLEDAGTAPNGVLTVGYGNGGMFGGEVGSVDSYVVRFAMHQPDGSAHLAGTPPVGEDAYAPYVQSTPAARVARGDHARFVITTQNDGDVAESFRVRGCGPLAGVRVRYFRGEREITDAVRTGWRSPRTARGDRRSISAVVKALPGAELGTRTCTIVQRSVDRRIGTDQVRLTMRVVR